MGKKYFCDYCDKSFADSQTNRKKHMSGVQHRQNRKFFYDSCQDPTLMLAEENLKRPCKKFFSGNCEFGPSCKYSHMTPDERGALQYRVQMHTENESRKQMEKYKNPLLSDWLKKHNKIKSINKDSINNKEKDYPLFNLPECLQTIKNLPPSLLPPSHLSYVTTPFVEWGN